jgi:nucleotide-binding universal stress UspA family protein
MYKHILIATDGSELAHKAVVQALALAKAVGARTTVVNVSEPLLAITPSEVAMAFPVKEYEESVAANARRILSAVEAEAVTMGVPCAAIHVRDQIPAEGIIETATGEGCDLIVMASHGRRGLMRFLLGGQAIKVLTNSTVPVLICR